MATDVSVFHPLVVADTCTVWNVLSSSILHRQSSAAGCSYSLTEFVLYECLAKPRRIATEADEELQRRLRAARDAGQFASYGLTVEDLQDVAIMERRRKLSKGELTAIVFAMKTRQAFMTDDRKARSLASEIMDVSMVQSTPHLVGWLVFNGRIASSEITQVVEEHERLGRPLRASILEMQAEGERCRTMARRP